MATNSRMICQLYLLVYAIFFVILVCNLSLIQSQMHHTNNRSQMFALDLEFTTRFLEFESNWKCRDPKPVLIYLTEAHPKILTPSFLWIPPAAVIHQCEKSSGCCYNHPLHTCKPNQTEEVSVIFRKVNMVTSEQSYEQLTFLNHTACQCQPS